jgi:membrane-associated phospholipid phosphatase
MPLATLASPERRSNGRGILDPFQRNLAILIVCVTVVLLVIVVARLMAGSTSWAQTELPVDQFLSRHHVAVLDAVALGIRWLVSPVPGLILVLLVSAAVLIKTRDGMVAVTFALVVSGGYLSSEIVKIIVHRARPDYHLLAHPLSTEANFASFPSGHTCLATALAVGFILLLRGRPGQKWAVVIGAVGVLIVGWSRLYIGAHYPTDILGSIIYTTAIMIAFLAVWNQWVAAPMAHLTKRLRSPSHHR